MSYGSKLNNLSAPDIKDHRREGINVTRHQFCSIDVSDVLVLLVWASLCAFVANIIDVMSSYSDNNLF